MDFRPIPPSAHNSRMIPRFLDRLLRRTNRKVGPDLTLLTLERPRDWSEQYPDVPKPETSLSIQLIAARWACNDLHGEDMPRIAGDLLETGLDSAGLRRLAAETQVSCSADVEHLLARVFREFEIPYPMPEGRAQLVFARQTAREVIAGHCDPWPAAFNLEKAMWGRYPKNEDLASIFALNDEWAWDADYQRFVPVMTSDLIEVFARLGKMSDAEVFAES